MSDDNTIDTSAKNDGSDSTSTNTQTSDNATQGAKNTSGDAKNDAGATTDTTKDADTVSKADYDSIMKRMQAADRAKIAAEKKLKDKDDADLSATEKATKEAAESKAEAEKLKNQLRTEKILNSFLTIKDVNWHDSADAFALLDRAGVDIDSDTGKVTGMDAAVKALAKKKPHLVNTGTTEGSTGPANNSNRKGDLGNDVSKADRVRRFPAAFNR